MLPTPKFAVDTRVYEPSEDTFFLMDCLEARRHVLLQYDYPAILEIGSGSGIVSAFTRSLGLHGIYNATDVNLHACTSTISTWAMNFRKIDMDIEVIRADKIPFRPNTVDILILNPPYVPSEKVPEYPLDDDDSKWLYLALDGGQDGMQVTRKVLENLSTILASEGVAFILFCGRNKPFEVKKHLESKGWLVDHVATRKAGWEILTVLQLSKGPTAQPL